MLGTNCPLFLVVSASTFFATLVAFFAVLAFAILNYFKLIFMYNKKKEPKGLSYNSSICAFKVSTIDL